MINLAQHRFLHLSVSKLHAARLLAIKVVLRCFSEVTSIHAPRANDIYLKTIIHFRCKILHRMEGMPTVNGQKLKMFSNLISNDKSRFIGNAQLLWTLFLSWWRWSCGFSTKHWDSRSRADLIECATPGHDAQVIGPYQVSSPLRMTVVTPKLKDYGTAPQHLQSIQSKLQSLSINITMWSSAVLTVLLILECWSL